jgi:hypothetical protein
MCANTVFAVVAIVLVMYIRGELRRANRELDAFSDLAEQDVFGGAYQEAADVTVASPRVPMRYIT